MVFDFVIIVHNNAYLHSTFSYYGRPLSVNRAIKGISQTNTTYAYSSDYGLSGKLKFIIHIPYNALLSGPNLNEI